MYLVILQVLLPRSSSFLPFMSEICLCSQRQMDSFSFVPNSKGAFYQCLVCLPVAEDSEEFIGCRITILVLKSREDRDFYCK